MKPEGSANWGKPVAHGGMEQKLVCLPADVDDSDPRHIIKPCQGLAVERGS